MSTSPKILTFDIETAPNLGHIWSFWNTNVGLNQLLESGWIISFVAKWLGEDEVYYMENRDMDSPDLVAALAELIGEADMVIGHNVERFDLGWIRAECARLGVPPFAPVKAIDTLRVAKKYFYMPSNKLEYCLKRFGLVEKSSHKKFPGHDMWMECVVNDNDEAWKEMIDYNIQDVVGNEELYLYLLPWIANHPNVAMYSEDGKQACTACGNSEAIIKRGFARTNLSKFQRYVCDQSKGGCGKWSRGRVNLLSKEVRKGLLANIV